MDMTFRAATPAERLYTTDQSMQIEGQTGCIGHLRADMGADGNGFFRTWKDHRQNLDTEEFQREFEWVLNALVDEKQYGDFLKSRSAMGGFCREHPESCFSDGFAFGFRADTEQYAYLIRLQPYGKEENLFIYCYRRDWLDRHLKQAEKGIRFIDPDYKELFRIPDGDQVRIVREDGTQIDKTARYIDEYHVEIGDGWDSTFHICQFAEQMERCGNKVIPLRSSLPEHCYVFVETSNEIGIVRKGRTGYYLTDLATGNHDENRELVKELNEKAGLTPGQAAAMKAGSVFGWHVPAADPKSYDEQGKLIKPKRHDRGDAR